MGFFSWNCKVCGHPLLSNYVTTEKNQWMNDVVALLNDGSVLRGEYDGYGRLNDHEMDMCGEPECYHAACWKLAGKPSEYTEGSYPSADQGYFFDDEVHDFEEPKTMKEAEILQIVGKLHNRLHKDNWSICRLECLIDDAYKAIKDLSAVHWTDESNKVLDDLERHLKRREEKDNKKQAERLGLSYDDFLELKGYFKELDNEKGEDTLRRFQNAEKIGEGTFRLTTSNDVVYDHDFINDKRTMVDDPYGCVPTGVPQEEWMKYA